MSHAWMPFYVADYLADTGHLSTVEHGAYLLLIMHYWQHGGLPTDDKRLARIARLSDGEWDSSRDTLAMLFLDGWRHKRIDAELANASRINAQRKAAGKAGASARYGKRIAEPQQTNAQSQPPSQKVATQPSAREAAKPNIGIPVILWRGERTREWFDQIEDECREAAGLTESPDPMLKDTSPIVTLIDQGYDFARDILPKLRAAKAAKKKGRTWAYYVPAITEGKAVNGTIQTKPNGGPAKPMVWVLRESPDWERHAAAYRAQHGRDPPHIGGLGGTGWHFPLAEL